MEDALQLPQLKFISETHYQFTPKKRFSKLERHEYPKFAEFNKITWNPETERRVRVVYETRNKSTYQVSYGSREDRMTDDSDQMMEYFTKLYSDVTKDVMRPLPSAVKLFGEKLPSRYIYNLTTYQDGISKEGYNILRVNFDKGIPRL